MQHDCDCEWCQPGETGLNWKERLAFAAYFLFSAIIMTVGIVTIARWLIG